MAAPLFTAMASRLRRFHQNLTITGQKGSVGTSMLVIHKGPAWFSGYVFRCKKILEAVRQCNQWFSLWSDGLSSTSTIKDSRTSVDKPRLPLMGSRWFQASSCWIQVDFLQERQSIRCSNDWKQCSFVLKWIETAWKRYGFPSDPIISRKPRWPSCL